MIDWALKGAGLACACGSVVFAAHMFTHQEGGPRVNAMEDFALFAQPNRIHAVEAAVRAAVAVNDPRRTGKAIEIDMTPIGATAPAGKPKKIESRRDVKIIEMNGETALIETPAGYRRVRVGDDIPELGKVISLRRMDDYWVVVGSLRSLAQGVPPQAAKR